MPASTRESPRVQYDRDRQRGRAGLDEPRRFDQPRSFVVGGVDTATQHPSPHAGYDADLNPIDDELINSHGSER
jgi:hypothetical protein